MGNQVRANVERANADDHGIEFLQPIRRQVIAGERGDFVTHVCETLGHVVAGAGKVTDLMAPDGEVEADGLEPGGRLQQQQRNVRIIDYHALVVVTSCRRPPPRR